MQTKLTREDAIALLRKYNKEPFHILHGLTVGGVLKWYANELGYGDEAGFWEICGILHDIDFEEYPEEHCLIAPRLLKEGGAEDEVIHAVCSHGYGICSDVKPESTMEKVLFTIDELTGLINAVCLMRPSKSTKDMELKSLKKKFKDKSFAAGVDRNTIRTGCEMLGMELDDVIRETIEGMKEKAEALGLKGEL